MSTKTLMTVEQFAQMHTADSEDYELVGGELNSLSSGTYRHNRIRDLIGHLLWLYFRQNRIGEAVGENDCQIALDEVRRPDVSVFLKDRLGRIDPDRIPSPFAPDIAVEIVSPSESAVDLRRKIRDYLRGGSSEVWIVDHSNGEVLIHSAAGIKVLEAQGFLETPLLPGFSENVAEIIGGA